jgi:CubicO group peptidase (beta-lactamase class C family)
MQAKRRPNTRWFLLALAFIVGLYYQTKSHANPNCGIALTKWVAKNAPIYNIKGLSLAVRLSSKTTCTLTYGVRHNAKKVTEKTLFNAASISKPLSALTALKLFKEKKLDINAPIDRYLKSWHLPPNKRFSNQQVTLKNLLNHTSGISGFRCKGYPINTPLPTLIQALNGLPPANTPKVTLIEKPNTTFLYSPAAYMIVEQVLQDITKQSFRALMKNNLLTPLGMYHSTFKQPLPNSLLNQIAYPYLPNGKPLRGGPFNFAAKAAGSLWTTPKELILFLKAIQESLQSNSPFFFDKALIHQFLTPSINPNFALGIEVTLNKYGNAEEKGIYFGHSGWNSGFISYMLASQTSPQAMVVMINTAPLMTSTHPVKQFDFIKALNKKIAHIYHWQ